MNVLLYGSETYLLDQNQVTLIQKVVVDSNQMNTVFYDALSPDFSITQLIEEADTLPFLSDHKAVIVDNCHFLVRGSSLSEPDEEALKKYLSAPHSQTSLILRYDDDNLDTSKRIVKHIMANCEVIHIKKLSSNDFRVFLKNEIKLRKMNLKDNAFEELIIRLDDSMSLAMHELDKLELYGSSIELEDVIALVARPLDSEAFHLVNALLDKDLKKAWLIWNDMMVLKIDPLSFIGLIASQLRILYQVSVLKDQKYHREDIINTLSTASSSLNVFRLNRLLQLCAKTNTNQILSVLNHLAIYDQRSKTGLVDKRFGFEMFMIEASH